MKFANTHIKDLVLIEIEPYVDMRGEFFRTFCKKEFADYGLCKDFVQINQSVNHKKGTFRGFHYQKPPYTDEKLVRCISGSVLDIVIDIRKNSPTFLENFSVELSAANKKMLYIPYGFAHGFITLEDHTNLIYQHSAFHSAPSEAGINYLDPQIGVEFPIKMEVVSERDLDFAFLKSEFIGI